MPDTIHFEEIVHEGIRYAEIIWADTRIEMTRFFSPAESSFQFGILAHHAGFIEAAHTHMPVERQIKDLQQMFVVQRGIVHVDFYTPEKTLLRTVELRTGDAILLVHGNHAVRATEDMQCISVKQGPFLGAEKDKVLM